MWATLEPFHAMIYFAEAALDRWEALGLSRGRMGYFASRAAPMGAVAAPVVAATFYNFSPTLVARFIPAAWDIASPDSIVENRWEAADEALRRFLGDAIEGGDMREAADVAEAAAGACSIVGRPLFAGHSVLQPPPAPHLRLWHAVTLLREYRGDGHTAALIDAGLSGIDAVVSYAITGQGLGLEFYQRSRGWSADEWANSLRRLTERGWIDDGGELSPEGESARERIEAATDRASMEPWEAIGQESADWLRATMRPWSRAIVAAGGLGG